MSMPEALTHPIVFLVICLALGLAVGSFLNVVIHRLPKMMEQQWRREYAELNGEAPMATARFDLVMPRSQCPNCGHLIRATHNIPLVSYVYLGGKCAACGSAISLRYPAVEALSAALSAFVAWHFGPTLAAVSALFFVWTMIALAFIDLDTFYLPDDLTYPLLWAGLLLNVRGVFVDLQSAVIGAAAGYLALWLVFWSYKLLTGKEGMGYGDFKLLAAIGGWLGWKMLPLVVLLSSFVGAVIGIILIVVTRRGRNVPIPFGPYLAIAGLIALFYGDTITRYYLQLF